MGFLTVSNQRDRTKPAATKTTIAAMAARAILAASWLPPYLDDDSFGVVMTRVLRAHMLLFLDATFPSANGFW